MKHAISGTTSWRQMLDGLPDGHHVAQLYRNDEHLAETASHYIAQGLQRGEAVVIVATAAHWAAFVARLATHRTVDLIDVVMRGQLRIMDAEVTLSALMANGMPQWERMQERAGDIIARSRKRFGRVRIYGEMGDILWQKGNRQAAERLEELWSKLARQETFSLVCAHRADEADQEAYAALFECVCRTHTDLVPRVGWQRETACPQSETDPQSASTTQATT